MAFDLQCRTESGCDYLKFFKDANMSRVISSHDGSRGGSDFSDFTTQGSRLYFRFESDSSGNDWGWKFTVSKRGEKDNSEPEDDAGKAEDDSKLKLGREALKCAMRTHQGAQQLSRPHRFKQICQVCSFVDILPLPACEALAATAC